MHNGQRNKGRGKGKRKKMNGTVHGKIWSANALTELNLKSTGTVWCYCWEKGRKFRDGEGTFFQTKVATSGPRLNKYK